MKYAIISDIHANLEALCNVLDDVEKHSVDEIICLGDIVDDQLSAPVQPRRVFHVQLPRRRQG